MRIYTRTDCEPVGDQADLYQKVVVCGGSNLAQLPSGQLFLCVDRKWKDTGQTLISCISLANGEQYLCRREDIIGSLKPELLPDESKLHLSQICRHEDRGFEDQSPLYSGYCFLKDGKYAAGVWLYSEQEVRDYIELQKMYQHRVLICDRDDFAVMEIVEGKMVFPDEQALREFYREHGPDGGMTMA